MNQINSSMAVVVTGASTGIGAACALDCAGRGMTVFAGVRDLPTRVKCAILPWHTLHAAFNAVSSTSTESEDDPMHAPIGDA